MLTLFASDPLYQQQFEYIDAENGVIRGVKVVSEGEAKGHGLFLNKKFISDVVQFGENHQPGIKARFGHPNMCSTALGTYIGRYHNFRLKKETSTEFQDVDKNGKPTTDGERYHAVADLHLDRTARDLPKLGNVWNYLTNLANTSPDMFGSSIVFRQGEPTVHEWEDEQGVTQRRKDATIQKLVACDLVDSPAATEGLFEQFDSEELALQVTQFLDQHPEVYDLAIQHPDVVENFLTKYSEYRKLKTTEMSDDKKTLAERFEDLKTWISEKFKSEDSDEVTIPEEVTNRLTEFETEISKEKEESSELSELKETAEKAAEELESLKGEIETLKSEKADLETQVKEAQEKAVKLEGDLTKMKGKSTTVKGAEGMEDEGENEPTEMKSLRSDLANLRRQLSSVHE